MSKIIGTIPPLRVGEKKAYGLNLTQFCSRYWTPNDFVPVNEKVRPREISKGGPGPNGYEGRVTIAGLSSDNEPNWPTVLGTLTPDGTATWVTDALSLDSYKRTINTVSWVPPTGITVSGETTQVNVGEQKLAAFLEATQNLDSGEIRIRVNFNPDGEVEDFILKIQVEGSTLVQETGSGLSNANAYDTISEISAFLEGTPNFATWSALDEEAQRLVAIKATEYVDLRWRFYGSILGPSQALQWPRTKNYDDKGRIIQAGVIPTQLKKAVAMVAGHIASDAAFLEGILSGAGAVKSWSTDGLSVNFDVSETGPESFVALGDRLINVELTLRSIGTYLNIDWLQTNKQTVVA